METQFTNFDMNALFSSSDDPFAAVVGKKSNQSPDQKSGEQFSDQFAKAEITVKVGSKALEGETVPSTTVDDKLSIDTDTEVVSFLSESFEFPVGLTLNGDVPSAKVSDMPPLNTAELDALLPAKQIEDSVAAQNTDIAESDNPQQPNIQKTNSKSIDDDDQVLVTQFNRNPVGLNFAEWESGFAATAPMRDNFSAVESAIAKYSTQKMDQKTANDSGSNQANASLATTPKTGEAISQNSVSDDMKLLQPSKSENVAAILDEGEVGIDPVKNVTSVASVFPKSTLTPLQEVDDSSKIEIRNNASGENAAPVDAEKLAQISQSGKPQLMSAEGQKNQLFTSATERDPSHLNEQASTKSVSGEWVNKTDPALVQKLAVAAGSDKAIPEALSLAQFKEDRSLATPASADVLGGSVEANKLASSIKRTMGTKVDLVSEGKNADTQETVQIKYSDSLAMPSPLDAKKPPQASKLLDSLYLRNGNKGENSRPMAESGRMADYPVSEVADANPNSMKLEQPTIMSEKNAQILNPAHLLNPTSQATTQKPTSFDWNAPKFAERFATEISDLNINGDLKKFEINPRNLGRLEVSLVARGTSEIVRIEAESQAARDVIMQHSQAIQEVLKAQGRSDLSVRVDLKDAGFASSSESNGQQLAQQDGTGTREDRSNRQSTSHSAVASEITSETKTVSDDGRYA